MLRLKNTINMITATMVAPIKITEPGLIHEEANMEPLSCWGSE